MHKIRMTILAATLLGASLVGGLASTAQVIEHEGEPDIVYASASDALMGAAQQKARASLDHFWAAKEAGSANTGAFVIKVGLATNDESLEHIWVENLTRRGDVYKGVLANEPYNLANGLGYGDKVKFTVKDVSDWSYNEGERRRGHFTTRVLVNEMPPESAAEILASLHEEPLP